MASPGSKARKAGGSAQTPLLEWVAAAIGLGLTLGVIGVVVWGAVKDEPGPPAVSVEALKASRTPAGHVLEVRVTNAGGSPAAQVAIEGELTKPGGETETSEATFDYVPGHSSRRGGLFFRSDPAAGELKLRAKGYIEP